MSFRKTRQHVISMKNHPCSYKVFLIACQWGGEDWKSPELLFRQNRFTPLDSGSDSTLRCQVRMKGLDHLA